MRTVHAANRCKYFLRDSCVDGGYDLTSHTMATALTPIHARHVAAQLLSVRFLPGGGGSDMASIPQLLTTAISFADMTDAEEKLISALID